MQDAQLRMCIHAAFLTYLHPPHGRSCMASIKAAAARERKRPPRGVGAAAMRPIKSRSARAHPAAAPAACGAAAVAADTAAPAQATQDAIRVVLRGPAAGHAAAAPARSAEELEAASMWLLAERERSGGDPAAGRLRHRMAAEDDVGMSDGSDAFGTFDSASESGGAAGKSPHEGGACSLSLAVLLSLRLLLSLKGVSFINVAIQV